ncbi:MAG: porin [Alphaproteobacteria bacterium]|jgi:outer membrane protein OmpU|nr:porin [Alphaproteobacteria bacterium]
MRGFVLLILLVGVLFSVRPAQASDKTSLSIGGYMVGFVIFGDEDTGPAKPAENRRNHKVAHHGELYFRGKTTLDNGLKAGMDVQLIADTALAQIDDSFMWFAGDWGRINLGGETSAPGLMYYGPPVPSFGGHGLDSPIFIHVAPGTNATARLAFTVPARLTVATEKIT